RELCRIARFVPLELQRLGVGATRLPCLFQGCGRDFAWRPREHSKPQQWRRAGWREQVREPGLERVAKLVAEIAGQMEAGVDAAFHLRQRGRHLAGVVGTYDGDGFLEDPAGPRGHIVKHQTRQRPCSARLRTGIVEVDRRKSAALTRIKPCPASRKLESVFRKWPSARQ